MLCRSPKLETLVRIQPGSIGIISDKVFDINHDPVVQWKSAKISMAEAKDNGDPIICLRGKQDTSSPSLLCRISLVAKLHAVNVRSGGSIPSYGVGVACGPCCAGRSCETRFQSRHIGSKISSTMRCFLGHEIVPRHSFFGVKYE